MSSTFGSLVLSINQIIDGKILTYSYCNRVIPEKVRTFQMEFHLRLSRLITTICDTNSVKEVDNADLDFIKLCVENIENISNENLDWYVPNI